MCYKISTETIIINYFAETTKDTLSFYELGHITSKIKKASNYGILAETNAESLKTAVTLHNNIFELEPTYIKLVSNCENIKTKILSLKKAQDFGIPDDVKSLCHQVFAECK